MCPMAGVGGALRNCSRRSGCEAAPGTPTRVTGALSGVGAYWVADSPQNLPVTLKTRPESFSLMTSRRRSGLAFVAWWVLGTLGPPIYLGAPSARGSQGWRRAGCNGQPLTLRGDVDHEPVGPRDRMGPNALLSWVQSAKPLSTEPCDERPAVLFDHLVGAHEQRRRNFKPKRLRRFEIEGQLDSGGLLDRQVGRFGAVENPAHKDAELTPAFKTTAVAHQAAGQGIFTHRVDGGKSLSGSQRGELFYAPIEECGGQNYGRAGMLLGQSREGIFELVIGSGVQNKKLQA
jgi:hypothetical protein